MKRTSLQIPSMHTALSDDKPASVFGEIDVLGITSQVLKGLQTAADYSPIPYLQTAANLALTIVQSIQVWFRCSSLAVMLI